MSGLWQKLLVGWTTGTAPTLFTLPDFLLAAALASPYQDFAVEQDAMTFGGPNAGASIERINPRMQDGYTVARLPVISADRPVAGVKE